MIWHQWMKSAVKLLLLVLVVIGSLSPQFVLGDIVFENEQIVTSEIFDLIYALDSNVSIYLPNQSKYYCIFRSNWNKLNTPADFPELARWGSPVIFSHTKQYVPFLKNREAPLGVKVIAQDGFTGTFQDNFVAAGTVGFDFSQGEAFNLNQKDWSKNYEYLPAVNITSNYNFLSGIASIKPSPDWFTGFYLFDVTKQLGQIYWDSFKLRTYPWDAGTDNGQWYTDVDQPNDPPGNIVRFTPENAPNGILVNKTGNDVPYVAELECTLYTCPLEDPGCVKEDWPPANGCDILRYPDCAVTCDPSTTSPCEQCSNKEYHQDCCSIGFKPLGKNCNNAGNASDASYSFFMIPFRSALAMLFSVLILI